MRDGWTEAEEDRDIRHIEEVTFATDGRRHRMRMRAHHRQGWSGRVEQDLAAAVELRGVSKRLGDEGAQTEIPVPRDWDSLGSNAPDDYDPNPYFDTEE